MTSDASINVNGIIQLKAEIPTCVECMEYPVMNIIACSLFKMVDVQFVDNRQSGANGLQ